MIGFPSEVNRFLAEPSTIEDIESSERERDATIDHELSIGWVFHQRRHRPGKCHEFHGDLRPSPSSRILQGWVTVRALRPGMSAGRSERPRTRRLRARRVVQSRGVDPSRARQRLDGRDHHGVRLLARPGRVHLLRPAARRWRGGADDPSHRARIRDQVRRSSSAAAGERYSPWWCSATTATSSADVRGRPAKSRGRRTAAPSTVCTHCRPFPLRTEHGSSERSVTVGAISDAASRAGAARRRTGRLRSKVLTGQPTTMDLSGVTLSVGDHWPS